MWNSQKLIGHFQKAHGLSHNLANAISGEQRSFHSLLSVSCTLTHLFSLWAMWSEQPCDPWPPGGSLSCPPGEALTDVFECSLAGEHGTKWPWQLYGWPMAMCAPHAGLTREPEMNGSWQQAKLHGWRLKPLSSYLQAPKHYTLNWSRNPGHGLLFWPCWGRLDFFQGRKRSWALRQESAILPDCITPE